MQQSEETRMAVMGERINQILEKVTNLERNQQENFVTKIEFDPIKRLVYGLISLVLSAVAIAVIGLVIIRS